MNVTNPNSPQNTTVFCAFAADESPPNLHIALDGFVDEINNLMESQWRDMPMEVFLSGDLEILRKLLGLQGSSATYPCVFCLAEKKDLRTGTATAPRTILQICEDCSKVAAAGSTTQAKKANHSVNEEPFFKIPVDHVVPPSLHINLGLWSKYFTELENDLQNLGQIIVDDLARKDTVSQTGDKIYQHHVHESRQRWQEIGELRRRAEELRDEIVESQYGLVSQGLLATTSSEEPTQEQMEHTESLQQQAKNLDAKADLIQKSNLLPKPINPLIHALDGTLKDFKVRRHAFASLSFVGNHVKKCLKPENYNHMLNTVIEKTRELTENSDIWDLAEHIKIKYMILFEKFSKCHSGMLKAQTEDEMKELESDIEGLVDYFKSKFPKSTVTPKFHILWMHVIDFIKLTGVPLGIMGEQGGENLHAQFNKIRKRLVGILNTKKGDPELQLLTATLEEHLIVVHPSNRKYNSFEE